MNINLRTLVKESNFKHYVFLVSGCKGKQFECEIKHKNGVGIVNFNFVNPEESNPLNYNIVNNWDCFATRPDDIAREIDGCKAFKFHWLEYDKETETAYIHLRLK